MRVLFVCTGNVCRSPMAEFFLRREAADRGLDLSVRSTGTHAWEGRAATIDGRRIMAELGTPMDGHKTLTLDQALVDWADLIVGLAAEHVREVLRDFPSAKGRTFALKEVVHVLPELPADGGFVEAVARARESVAPPEDLDVDDPFGERDAAYRRVATEIQGLVARLAEGLAERNGSS